jgi:hypothetical protein
MTSNPFWGSLSDKESKKEKRDECLLLIRTARLHVRLFRLKMRKEAITGPERNVLGRMQNDLYEIITGSKDYA